MASSLAADTDECDRCRDSVPSDELYLHQDRHVIEYLCVGCFAIATDLKIGRCFACKNPSTKQCAKCKRHFCASHAHALLWSSRCNSASCK